MSRRKVRPPENILISHVYSSDNKGDAALVSVLIQDLRRKFKNAKITILKLDASPAGSKFEGVPETPSFMSYALNKYRNPLAKLGYSFFMMTATLLWAAWYRFADGHIFLPKHLRAVASLYEQADLIVPVGGGYMRSRAGLLHRFNIPLLLHPLLFGYLLGKPTVLYAQSVGPFQNKFEEALVTFVLNRMTLVMVREDTSMALLARLGIQQNIVRAIDSGFLLGSTKKANVRKLYGIPRNALLVGVTVRAWLKGEAQAQYEQAVAKALDALIKNSQAYVIFIPQVTANKGDDDRLVSRRVRRLMRHKLAATVINDAPDHHRIKALYGGLDILLGTRFHSVIFSLTSFVPVVAIEYEHKTSGIMRDLNLEDWVIKIEDVTSQNLTALLQKLVQNQAAYRTQLKEQVPPYVQKAKQTIHMLEESYYSAPTRPGLNSNTVQLSDD